MEQSIELSEDADTLWLAFKYQCICVCVCFSNLFLTHDFQERIHFIVRKAHKQSRVCVVQTSPMCSKRTIFSSPPLHVAVVCSRLKRSRKISWCGRVQSADARRHKNCVHVHVYMFVLAIYKNQKNNHNTTITRTRQEFLKKLKCIFFFLFPFSNLHGPCSVQILMKINLLCYALLIKFCVYVFFFFVEETEELYSFGDGLWFFCGYES